MAERECVFDGECIALFSDGTIGISDGVGFIDELSAEQTEELRQALNALAERRDAEAHSEMIIKAQEDCPPKCTWTEDENGAWETECGGIWEFVEGARAKTGCGIADIAGR